MQAHQQLRRLQPHQGLTLVRKRQQQQQQQPPAQVTVRVMCRQPPAQQQQHPLKGLGESVQAGWDLLQTLQQMGQQQQMVRQQGRLQVVQQQLRIVAPGAAVDAGAGVGQWRTRAWTW
jgi:hypothetical protein